jgi:hypothetical protein
MQSRNPDSNRPEDSDGRLTIVSGKIMNESKPIGTFDCGKLGQTLIWHLCRGDARFSHQQKPKMP